jgi:hypothetical protein
MSNVFLLGAGFSKAIHDAMPSLGELSVEVRKLVDQLPPPLPALGSNVELWLTYLSQPQPWLNERQTLTNKALFLEMTEKIRDVLDNRTDTVLQTPCPAWLTKLVEGYWHKAKPAIITFNYDTLVERVCHRDLKYIYPLRLVEASTGMTIPGNLAGAESLKLLKLHGSVNWYYSGTAPSYGETLYYYKISRWGQARDDERQSKAALKGFAPLIVPPTSEKTTYFQHEMIRHIWAEASRALQAATHIYCIGYSMPVTDLSTRYLLLHSRPAGKVPLFVVNTANDVVPRYKQLVGDAYEIRDDYVGDDALTRLLGDLLKT